MTSFTKDVRPKLYFDDELKSNQYIYIIINQMAIPVFMVLRKYVYKI